MDIINLVIAVLSIITMGVCIVLLMKLRKKLSGGIIKKRMTLLFGLLVFFFFGYLLSPLFSYIEQFEYTTLLVYLVFLFGAVFVLVTIDTLGTVLKLSGIISKDK